MANHTEDNLQRLIEAIARRGQAPLLVTVGKVSNIDEDKRICDIAIDDDLTLNNCRLNAIIDSYSNRLLIVPKENSMVAFIAIGGKLTEPLIIAYSEIDKVLLKIGNTEVNIDTDKVEINGGDNDGIIKIQDLTDKLNNLVDWCKNHTHSGVITAVSGGSGAPAVGTSGNTGKPISSPASFNKSDYEDTKVTH